MNCRFFSFDIFAFLKIRNLIRKVSRGGCTLIINFFFPVSYLSARFLYTHFSSPRKIVWSITMPVNMMTIITNIT